ncbi:MAG: hypothetical protein K9H64_05070 [Bacteroidales bacterium]|nr:hypothetical protein [Bacteroidales bacterium]MCF8455209.1 hypothetical protein [Bacteroidales bacterium]
MKSLMLIMFIQFSLFFFVSNEDKVYYSASGIYMNLLDGNLELVTSVPFGKKPSIVYDRFFKKYYIEFKDEKDELSYVEFIFFGYTQEGYMRFKDPSNATYWLIDMLKENSTLTFVSEKLTDNGLVSMLVIKDIKEVDK